MQLTKINISSLLFFILCSCTLIFSLNNVIVASFRLLDILFIVLILFFIATNPKVNKTLLLVLLISILVFALSNIIGILNQGNVDITRIAFLYKYFFIFSLPWVVVNLVKTDRQMKILNTLILINFIFLCCWTYIYLVLLASNIISGSWRPSFPLSTSYNQSDAHLYASYLGLSIVYYVFYLRHFFKHNIFLSFLIILNAIIAIILTGSRTGVVLVLFSIFLYGGYSFLKFWFVRNKSIVKRKNLFFPIFFLIPIFFIALIYSPIILDLFSDYIDLIIRSFNFNLFTDLSSIGRVEKLFIGIEDAEHSSFFLGLGLFSTLTWYDGIISILIAHGGLLFLLSIITFYFLLIKKAAINSTNQKDFLLFLFMVVLYLFANVITEYIYVSRNAFPSLLMISLLFINLSKNMKKKS